SRSGAAGELRVLRRADTAACSRTGRGLAGRRTTGTVPWCHGYHVHRDRTPVGGIRTRTVGNLRSGCRRPLVVVTDDRRERTRRATRLDSPPTAGRRGVRSRHEGGPLRWLTRSPRC